MFAFFNPELQFKDIESSITIKLLDLFSELGGFKFVITLVSKRIEREGKAKYDTFYSNS